jgi:hypothetical protein
MIEVTFEKHPEKDRILRQVIVETDRYWVRLVYTFGIEYWDWRGWRNRKGQRCLRVGRKSLDARCLTLSAYWRPAVKWDLERGEWVAKCGS